jgi:TrkA domain protein
MDIERTTLPGIGVRHLFATARRRRIGVISHRSGRQDLVIYSRDDPDSAELVTLTADEAGTLARLLGTSGAL